MNSLPPDKKLCDKYYIGFYSEEQLITIMDLIVNYPQNNTCYIGLFMIDIEKQNSGIGSQQQELFNVICMRKVLKGSDKNE